MTRCVVFDFDGVLVDSNDVKRTAFFDIFASLGDTREVVAECLAQTRQGDRYQVIERIIRRLGETGPLGASDSLPDAVRRYASHYNDICESYTATCPEIPGASQCLAQLVRHYVLYVNSATPEEPLTRVVRRRGWEAFFRGVFGGPGTKVENLRKVMQRENLGAGAVMFVGDRQLDLAAARSCGCQFIGMRNADDDFDQPDLVLVDNLYYLERAIRHRPQLEAAEF